MPRRPSRARWSLLAERLRASLWLFPGAMMVAALALAIASLALDHELGSSVAESWWARSGAEGTRETLSTVAGSVMTVAAVAFSLTIVVLQLASTQYSPRVIRSFRRDRFIQVALGIYTATFIYTVLVLRAISSGETTLFTAPISATVAIVLGIACMIALVAMVHHIARTVQVSAIIGSIADETRRSLDRQLPGAFDGRAEVSPLRAPEPDGNERTVPAPRDGYIDFVKTEPLEELEGAAVVRLVPCVGDFVRRGDALAYVWPRSASSEENEPQIADVFAIADERTIQQDVRYGLRLLVDIALRALSPGINDPTTAVQCVDALGALLCDVVSRRAPSPWRRLPSGLEIYATQPDTRELVRSSFAEIIECGASFVRVQRAVIAALHAIAVRHPTNAARCGLDELALRIVHATRREKLFEADAACLVHELGPLLPERGPARPPRSPASEEVERSRSSAVRPDRPRRG